jgi:hypothetical protein
VPLPRIEQAARLEGWPAADGDARRLHFGKNPAPVGTDGIRIAIELLVKGLDEFEALGIER